MTSINPPYQNIRSLGSDSDIINIEGTSITARLRRLRINYMDPDRIAVSFYGPLTMQQCALAALWWGRLGGDIGHTLALLIATDGNATLWSAVKEDI